MNLPTITLRALEPEDLDALYAIENDVECWDVGHTSVPYSRYALHDYIANASADIYADRQVRLAIANEEGDIVGLVDVMNFDPRHQRAEVGIIVKKTYRHAGYAHAAMQRILDLARTNWHLHQLYAIVDSCNRDAQSLFSDLGFHAENTLQSWLFDGQNYRDACLMQKFL